MRGGDVAAEDLIEDVDVDLSELLLNSAWSLKERQGPFLRFAKAAEIGSTVEPSGAFVNRR